MVMVMTREPSAFQTQIRKSVFVLCFMLLSIPRPAVSGGACTVAKELGNSLAIEWIADAKTTVDNAIENTKVSLQGQGYTKQKLRDVHVQASTHLTHGYMVIIKTKYKTPYKTRIGHIRTSYGCGFSDKSLADAEQAAVGNLRSYSWGWKSEYGYELHAKHEF